MSRKGWHGNFLKMFPKSAVHKTTRGMPTHVYFFSVSRTTFRGVEASWIGQVGIEIYRFSSGNFNPKEELDNVDKAQQVKLLGKKIYGATVRCGVSLVFASIGAGIGATPHLVSQLAVWLGIWQGLSLYHSVLRNSFIRMSRAWEIKMLM